jgi:glycosyltransferase involved in cell wall biosynthesis
VAFVHDALAFIGGAERTLAAMLELFPGAPVYTLVYNRKDLRGSIFADHPVHTSPLDRLPGIYASYRSFLPLFPFFIEQFDLRQFPLVISTSYAVAHGALVPAENLHLAYTFTPMRHAWHGYDDYFNDHRSMVHAWLARSMLHYFRLWDYAAAQRVDRLLAASELVAGRVRRYYRRTAEVLYPPVEVERFARLPASRPPGSYYLVVSRLRPHKRVDLVVEAINRLGYPLLVVGEGSERHRLEGMAGPNVSFLGQQSDADLIKLLAGARALVHAAEEDFGITIVEAQAVGCPVIAYGRGGAVETVIPEVTGVLFPEQSPDSLAEAVLNFQAIEAGFDVGDLRANAARFSKERFQGRFLAYLDEFVDHGADDGRAVRMPQERVVTF